MPQEDAQLLRPHPSTMCLNSALRRTIAAIVVEPLQGEGGFIPAPIEWIKEVRKICDEKGILLIADEVQSGFCRTGRMFASEYWKEAGVEPDIIATAKSIAAGVPLSAIVAREEIMEAPAKEPSAELSAETLWPAPRPLKTIEIMGRIIWRSAPARSERP